MENRTAAGPPNPAADSRPDSVLHVEIVDVFDFRRSDDVESERHALQEKKPHVGTEVVLSLRVICRFRCLLLQFLEEFGAPLSAGRPFLPENFDEGDGLRLRSTEEPVHGVQGNSFLRHS